MSRSAKANYILGLLLGVLFSSASSLLCNPPDNQPPYDIILLEPDQLRADSTHAYKGHELQFRPTLLGFSWPGGGFCDLADEFLRKIGYGQ